MITAVKQGILANFLINSHLQHMIKTADLLNATSKYVTRKTLAEFAKELNPRKVDSSKRVKPTRVRAR